MTEMQVQNIQIDYEWSHHTLQLPSLIQLQRQQIAFLQACFGHTQHRPKLIDIDYSVTKGIQMIALSEESRKHFEEMRIASLKVAWEFHCKNLFCNVAIVEQNGEYYFLKSGLSSLQIDKYRAMDEIGIGVKVICVNYQEGYIIMEAGIMLAQFVGRNMNIPQLTQNLMEQVNYIQITLRSIGVAHCDIKPQNMIVSNTSYGLKIFLIDMDFAAAYGQIREIGTYGRNVGGYWDAMGTLVHENTDDTGFQFVKNYLLATICGIRT